MITVATKNEAKILFKAETDEFSQAVRSANDEISTLRAEMKLNEAQFANTGDQAEYLQQKSQLLEAQLQANSDKQEALNQKIEVAKQFYGENSEEVAKLERQLIYAKTEEEKAAAFDRAEEELGDFMFATVNAARLYGIDPDTALNRACDKFRRRFTYLEENTIRQGRDLHEMTLAEMDAIWDEGKAKGL